MIELSIIVPVYNAERYIKDTINSILYQNYMSYEIIIINDGSTDSSAEILNQFASTYHNVIVVHQENRGATFARNIGLNLAKGKYILFFDSDDIMMNNVLFEMITLMQKEKTDLLLSDYYITDEDLNIKNEINIKNNSKNDFRCLINEIPFPGNKIYKKEIIENNNIQFDNVKIGQDLNFYIKYCLFVKSVSIYSKKTVKYRVLHNSISNSYDIRIIDIIKSMQYIKDYYIKSEHADAHINFLNELQLKHYVFQYSKLRYMKCSNEKKQIRELLSRNILKTLKIIKKNKYNKRIINHYIFSYIKTNIILLFN